MNSKNEQQATVQSVFAGRGWLLIILGILCCLLGGGSMNDALNVTIPKFVELYGWDSGLLSRIGTYGGWIAAGVMIFIGILMKKIGARKLLILAELDLTICLIAQGYVTSIAGYFVVFTFIAIGSLSIGMFAYGALVSHWFPTRKGLVMGYGTLGFNLGTCIVCWLLTVSWDKLGFRMGFVPYACVGIAALIITIFFISEYPEQSGYFSDNNTSMTKEQAEAILAEGIRYKETSIWTVSKLLKTKQTWLIAIAMGLFELCTVGTITNFVPIFQARGFSQVLAMTAMTVVGVIAMPCSITVGVLDNKIGIRKAAFLTSLFAGAMFLLAALPMTWTVIFAGLAGGTMMGGSNNLLVSSTTSVFGRFDYENAISVIYPIYLIFRAVGCGLVGTISSSFSVSAVMIVLAVFMGIAAIIMTRIPDDYLGRKETEGGN